MESIFNENNKFKEPIKCLMWMGENIFTPYHATFYKAVTDHKAGIHFDGGIERETKRFFINDNWVYSDAGCPPLVYYFGYYDSSMNQTRDFILKFEIKREMDEFVRTFESAVYFQNHFSEELNEAKINKINIELDENVPDNDENLIPDVNNDPAISIADLQHALNDVEIRPPKNNHFLRPYAPGIGRRAFNVTSRATKDQYLKYFDANDNTEPKSHWRSCPEATQRQQNKRLECDPIFNATSYNYVSLAAANRQAYRTPNAQPPMEQVQQQNQHDPFD